MDNKTKNQIAIALGWFVFFDVVLRTSSTIVNTFSNATSATQSVFYFLSNSNSYYDSPLSKVFYYNQEAYFFLAIVVGILIMAIVFLLQSTLKIWAGILRLTKAVAYFILSKSNNDEDSDSEKELMELLFGEKEAILGKNPSTKEERKNRHPRPVVFQLVSDLSTSWILIGIIYLMYALFSGLRF